ncbi:MAG: hypothetical protein HRU32_15145, partial [Rhodobacteraceae bacterium]|nr:hypothetical protein [Paracoccaceae bacterium]
DRRLAATMRAWAEHATETGVDPGKIAFLLIDEPGDAEEAHLDVLEVCTEALEGSGIYQGGANLGDRHVLYFYGDSYNAMKTALEFVLATNPLCRGAYARRLS